MENEEEKKMMGDQMEDMEEKQPMMEKKEEDVTPKNEYHETTRACCGCCSLKCLIIVYALAVCVDFGFECFNLYRISDNEYFDPIYFQVYLSLVILFAVAVCLILFYLVAPDSKASRGVLPWAFLIAGITGILIGTWVITYFYAIYSKSDKYVYVRGLDDDHQFS